MRATTVRHGFAHAHSFSLPHNPEYLSWDSRRPSLGERIVRSACMTFEAAALDPPYGL